MNEARPNSGIGVMADSSLKLTQRLLTKHRFRIAGTPECRLAAREIANIFRRSCDNVFEETFSLHPKALWLVGKALSIIYLAAALLGILGAYYLLISSFPLPAGRVLWDHAIRVLQQALRSLVSKFRRTERSRQLGTN